MDGVPPHAQPQIMGRERELAALWRQFELASAGQLRVVLLAGDPGIGKTRLLEGLAARTTCEGAAALRGGASEAAGMPPYLPFLEALGQHIRASSPDALREHTGALAPILARILPELPLRLGELPANYPLPPEQARLRLYEAVGAFLAAIGAPAALLLILDDLQWADPATLDLLCYIARHQTAARLLIVGAYREGEIAHHVALQRSIAELNRLRVLMTLSVGPLTKAEVAALARHSLGSPLDPAGIERLSATSEGNPFFAEELLRAWTEDGALVQAEQGWTLNAANEAALPASIVGAVQQRLARLPPDVVEVLRIAAVIGRTFDVTLLAEAAGQDGDAVEERLRVASQVVLLRSVGADRFSFSHDTIRACLYADLTSARRRRIHGLIGRALEAQPAPASAHRLAELAFHFARSGDRGRGTVYARQAAAQAIHTYAFSEAYGHYRVALELMDSGDPERGDVLISLGDAAVTAGAAEEAVAAFDAARAWFQQANDLLAAARASHRLGRAWWQREAISQAQAAFEAAAAALNGQPLPETVAVLVDLSSLLTLSLHQQEAGLEHARHALALAERLESDQLVTTARRALGNLLSRANNLHSGIPLLEQALELAVTGDDPMEAAECCACLRMACAWNGEYRRAIAYGRQEITCAQRCHAPYLLRHAYTHLAVLHLMAGLPAEAEQLLDSAKPVLEQLGSPEALAYLSFIRGAPAYFRGDYAAAEHLAAQAIAAFQRLNPHSVVWYVGPLVWAQAKQGNARAARAWLDQLEESVAALPGNSMPAAQAVSAAAAAALMLDDRARLFRLYPRLLPFRGRVCDALVDRLLGEIETLRGDFASAAVSLADAEALASREGIAWELAHLRIAQANLALARGGAASGEQAPALLVEAQALFQHYGNQTEGDRIQQRLDELARPLARASLPAGLSPREAEVLRLVAHGKTNRAIATALVISERTVINHLANIFAKTGADNRTAAAAFAFRHGLADEPPATA